MKIQILISNSSWVSSEYKKKFLSKLKKYSKKIFFTDTHLRLKKNYDLNIIFSYFKIVPSNYLKLSKHNIVVHGSNLPKGRGMSPITWQILEKKREENKVDPFQCGNWMIDQYNGEKSTQIFYRGDLTTYKKSTENIR